MLFPVRSCDQLFYFHDDGYMSCVGFDTCGEELDEDDMFKDDPISQIDIKVATVRDC